MRVHRSSKPDIAIEDCSITEFMLRHAERLGDKDAFINSANGTRMSYATLASRIRRLAGGLTSQGAGPGTTWALMAPNEPDYAVAFHGLAYAGATVTTLNPTYGADEISHQLRDSRASAIVTTQAFLETARHAAEQCNVEHVYLLDEGDAPRLTSLEGAPLDQQAAVDYAAHVVALPYSSGTTGFPKGVMLTHRNLVANLCQTLENFTIDESDVCYAVLPFFHIYGMQLLMNMALAQGATVVTAPRFDMEAMLKSVQEHQISRLFLVPPIVLGLAKAPIVDQYDTSSVRQIVSGAAPLPEDVAATAAQRLGCTLGQGYGLTETSPVLTITGLSNYRPGSVGTVVPNTEVRLVDADTGADAEPGERGELWARGPQVTGGYFGNAGATAATIDADGWLHTGDVAVIDDDGHVYIVDRLKELIKVNGFQVAPAELEARLLEHTEIVDAAVIGVPDDDAGERPKAFVVRGPDTTLDAEAVVAFAAENLVSYKHLAEVVFVDSIPKSASGKILRRQLRE